MEVSIHCGRRYIERIKDIPEKQAGPYYHQNKEQVDKEILKLFEYAKPFYQGKIKIHPSRSYSLHQNIIIVSDETTVITMFKVAFGSLSKEKVEDVLKIVMDDLAKQVEERDGQAMAVNEAMKTYREEISGADKEIARLKGLIEIEKSHISINQEYQKIEQVKLKQLDYGINDMFEAIIGKGFGSEL